MPSAVFLAELVAGTNARGGLRLALPCMAELEGTEWRQVELPAGGWVLQVEGTAEQLARIAAVPGVLRLADGRDPFAGDRVQAAAWLRRRGVQATAAGLATRGALSAALVEAAGLPRRAPRAAAPGVVAWDGPARPAVPGKLDQTRPAARGKL